MLLLLLLLRTCRPDSFSTFLATRHPANGRSCAKLVEIEAEELIHRRIMLVVCRPACVLSPFLQS